MLPIGNQTSQSPGVASPVSSPSFVAFFIGGAGDKRHYCGYGPTRLVRRAALAPFCRRMEGYPSLAPRIEYLGYEEIHGEGNVDAKVLPCLCDTKIPVYIIGHSFGGWNAAHLCRRLADGGCNVRMLVTLDPVGGGLVSRIGHGLYARPEVAPHAAFWVNVSCRPQGGNVSDVVASLGRRWYPQAGPDVYYESPRSHADVQAMFTEAVWQGRSALDMLEADIRDCLL